MLEKSTSSSANQSPVSMPTPSQLASIESDAFESVSFSSTRLPGKSEVCRGQSTIVCHIANILHSKENDLN